MYITKKKFVKKLLKIKIRNLKINVNFGIKINKIIKKKASMIHLN